MFAVSLLSSTQSPRLFAGTRGVPLGPARSTLDGAAVHSATVSNIAGSKRKLIPVEFTFERDHRIGGFEGSRNGLKGLLEYELPLGGGPRAIDFSRHNPEVSAAPRL